MGRLLWLRLVARHKDENGKTSEPMGLTAMRESDAEPVGVNAALFTGLTLS